MRDKTEEAERVDESEEAGRLDEVTEPKRDEEIGGIGIEAEPEIKRVCVIWIDTVAVTVVNMVEVTGRQVAPTYGVGVLTRGGIEEPGGAREVVGIPVGVVGGNGDALGVDVEGRPDAREGDVEEPEGRAVDTSTEEDVFTVEAGGREEIL